MLHGFVPSRASNKVPDTSLERALVDIMDLMSHSPKPITNLSRYSSASPQQPKGIGPLEVWACAIS